jgi:hypothetical protein
MKSERDESRLQVENDYNLGEVRTKRNFNYKQNFLQNLLIYFNFNVS